MVVNQFSELLKKLYIDCQIWWILSFKRICNAADKLIGAQN